jgi:hypothetical protein
VLRVAHRRLLLRREGALDAPHSLLAQRRYPEAEAALLDARRELESLPASGGAEMKVALARLVELYIAWGKREQAASYRTLLGS